MSLHSNNIIIILGAIVVLSYFFNLIARVTRIPSVLLLIGTGIGIRYFSVYQGFVQQDVSRLVKILGVVGLIMIVLEAALELEMNSHKLRLIRNSFLSALVISLVSAFGIGWLIQYWLGEYFDKAFLYAIPMSIISSAIVIPSTEHLPGPKKEFIIYESSFSDIIGILAFNYMLSKNVLSLMSGVSFLANIGLAIFIAVVASLFLIFILAKITIKLKFFLLFAVLSIIYATGEAIHLPSLLIILVFGLVLNNTDIFFIGKLKNFALPADMEGTLTVLRSITAETSFLIRTFFFILFGYTINLDVLFEPTVWKLGSLIVLVLLLIRFLYLRFILRTNLFPELFLMPRGLITILLFYSIPAEKSLQSFNVGILFFVVAVTSILMMLGLLIYRDDTKNFEMVDAEKISLGR